LRRAIHGLIAIDALPDGLTTALQQLASASGAAAGIPCRLLCEPGVHIAAPETALQLFRIAQEAVSNALRHGGPSQITISLQQNDRGLELTICDDGHGIGSLPAGHPGIGLESMRRRGQLLGGECAIQPAEGGGTIVSCRIPPGPALPPPPASLFEYSSRASQPSPERRRRS